MEPGLSEDQHLRDRALPRSRTLDDVPLCKLDTFEIQVWLNSLADKYSQSVVRHCFSNIRAITHMAKKQKFLTEDPGEDVTMPQTKPVEKPVMTQEQILALIGGIKDLHDLCLLYVGIFCGPRASEVMGLQWKSWTGEPLWSRTGLHTKGSSILADSRRKQSKAPIRSSGAGAAGHRGMAARSARTRHRRH